MSLAGFVASAVTSFLSEFVNPDDVKQAEIGLLEWRNLIIRQRYLIDTHTLPFYISYGIIGRLSITIPWNIFRSSESIEVSLEDVYLCIVPYTESEWTAEEAIQLELAQRRSGVMKTLEALFTSGQLGGNAKPSDSTGKSYLPGFIRRNLYSWLLTRLRISVRDLHIRYESGLIGLFPFSCGICLPFFLLACPSTKPQESGDSTTPPTNLTNNNQRVGVIGVPLTHTEVLKNVTFALSIYFNSDDYNAAFPKREIIVAPDLLPKTIRYVSQKVTRDCETQLPLAHTNMTPVTPNRLRVDLGHHSRVYNKSHHNKKRDINHHSPYNTDSSLISDYVLSPTVFQARISSPHQETGVNIGVDFAIPSIKLFFSTTQIQDIVSIYLHTKQWDSFKFQSCEAPAHCVFINSKYSQTQNRWKYALKAVRYHLALRRPVENWYTYPVRRLVQRHSDFLNVVKNEFDTLRYAQSDYVKHLIYRLEEFISDLAIPLPLLLLWNRQAAGDLSLLREDLIRLKIIGPTNKRVQTPILKTVSLGWKSGVAASGITAVGDAARLLGNFVNQKIQKLNPNSPNDHNKQISVGIVNEELLFEDKTTSGYYDEKLGGKHEQDELVLYPKRDFFFNITLNLFQILIISLPARVPKPEILRRILKPSLPSWWWGQSSPILLPPSGNVIQPLNTDGEHILEISLESLSIKSFHGGAAVMSYSSASKTLLENNDADCTSSHGSTDSLILKDTKNYFKFSFEIVSFYLGPERLSRDTGYYSDGIIFNDRPYSEKNSQLFQSPPVIEPSNVVEESSRNPFFSVCLPQSLYSKANVTNIDARHLFPPSLLHALNKSTLLHKHNEVDNNPMSNHYVKDKNIIEDIGISLQINENQRTLTVHRPIIQYSRKGVDLLCSIIYSCPLLKGDTFCNYIQIFPPVIFSIPNLQYDPTRNLPKNRAYLMPDTPVSLDRREGIQACFDEAKHSETGTGEQLHLIDRALAGLNNRQTTAATHLFETQDEQDTASLLIDIDDSQEASEKEEEAAALWRITITHVCIVCQAASRPSSTMKLKSRVKQYPNPISDIETGQNKSQGITFPQLSASCAVTVIYTEKLLFYLPIECQSYPATNTTPSQQLSMICSKITMQAWADLRLFIFWRVDLPILSTIIFNEALTGKDMDLAVPNISPRVESQTNEPLTERLAGVSSNIQHTLDDTSIVNKTDQESNKSPKQWFGKQFELNTSLNQQNPHHQIHNIVEDHLDKHDYKEISIDKDILLTNKDIVLLLTYGNIKEKLFPFYPICSIGCNITTSCNSLCTGTTNTLLNITSVDVTFMTLFFQPDALTLMTHVYFSIINRFIMDIHRTEISERLQQTILRHNSMKRLPDNTNGDTIRDSNTRKRFSIQNGIYQSKGQLTKQSNILSNYRKKKEKHSESLTLNHMYKEIIDSVYRSTLMTVSPLHGYDSSSRTALHTGWVLLVDVAFCETSNYSKRCNRQLARYSPLWAEVVYGTRLQKRRKHLNDMQKESQMKWNYLWLYTSHPSFNSRPIGILRPKHAVCSPDDDYFELFCEFYILFSNDMFKSTSTTIPLIGQKGRIISFRFLSSSYYNHRSLQHIENDITHPSMTSKQRTKLHDTREILIASSIPKNYSNHYWIKSLALDITYWRVSYFRVLYPTESHHKSRITDSVYDMYIQRLCINVGQHIYPLIQLNVYGISCCNESTRNRGNFLTTAFADMSIIDLMGHYTKRPDIILQKDKAYCHTLSTCLRPLSIIPMKTASMLTKHHITDQNKETHDNEMLITEERQQHRSINSFLSYMSSSTYDKQIPMNSHKNFWSSTESIDVTNVSESILTTDDTSGHISNTVQSDSLPIASTFYPTSGYWLPTLLKRFLITRQRRYGTRRNFFLSLGYSLDSKVGWCRIGATEIILQPETIQIFCTVMSDNILHILAELRHHQKIWRKLMYPSDSLDTQVNTLKHNDLMFTNMLSASLNEDPSQQTSLNDTSYQTHPHLEICFLSMSFLFLQPYTNSEVGRLTLVGLGATRTILGIEARLTGCVLTGASLTPLFISPWKRMEALHINTSSSLVTVSSHRPTESCFYDEDSIPLELSSTSSGDIMNNSFLKQFQFLEKDENHSQLAVKINILFHSSSLLQLNHLLLQENFSASDLLEISVFFNPSRIDIRYDEIPLFIDLGLDFMVATENILLATKALPSSTEQQQSTCPPVPVTHETLGLPLSSPIKTSDLGVFNSTNNKTKSRQKYHLHQANQDITHNSDSVPIIKLQRLSLIHVEAYLPCVYILESGLVEDSQSSFEDEPKAPVVIDLGCLTMKSEFSASASLPPPEFTERNFVDDAGTLAATSCESSVFLEHIDTKESTDKESQNDLYNFFNLSNTSKQPKHFGNKLSGLLTPPDPAERRSSPCLIYTIHYNAGQFFFRSQNNDVITGISDSCHPSRRFAYRNKIGYNQQTTVDLTEYIPLSSPTGANVIVWRELQIPTPYQLDQTVDKQCLPVLPHIIEFKETFKNETNNVFPYEQEYHLNKKKPSWSDAGLFIYATVKPVTAVLHPGVWAAIQENIATSTVIRPAPSLRPIPPPSILQMFLIDRTPRPRGGRNVVNSLHTGTTDIRLGGSGGGIPQYIASGGASRVTVRSQRQHSLDTHYYLDDWGMMNIEGFAMKNAFLKKKFSLQTDPDWSSVEAIKQRQNLAILGTVASCTFHMTDVCGRSLFRAELFGAKIQKFGVMHHAGLSVQTIRIMESVSSLNDSEVGFEASPLLQFTEDPTNTTNSCFSWVTGPKSVDVVLNENDIPSLVTIIHLSRPEFRLHPTVLGALNLLLFHSNVPVNGPNFDTFKSQMLDKPSSGTVFLHSQQGSLEEFLPGQDLGLLYRRPGIVMNAVQAGNPQKPLLWKRFDLEISNNKIAGFPMIKHMDFSQNSVDTEFDVNHLNESNEKLSSWETDPANTISQFTTSLIQKDIIPSETQRHIYTRGQRLYREAERRVQDGYHQPLLGPIVYDKSSSLISETEESIKDISLLDILRLLGVFRYFSNLFGSTDDEDYDDDASELQISLNTHSYFFATYDVSLHLIIPCLPTEPQIKHTWNNGAFCFAATFIGKMTQEFLNVTVISDDQKIQTSVLASSNYEGQLTTSDVRAAILHSTNNHPYTNELCINSLDYQEQDNILWDYRTRVLMPKINGTVSFNNQHPLWSLLANFVKTNQISNILNKTKSPTRSFFNHSKKYFKKQEKSSSTIILPTCNITKKPEEFFERIRSCSDPLINQEGNITTFIPDDDNDDNDNDNDDDDGHGLNLTLETDLKERTRIATFKQDKNWNTCDSYESYNKLKDFRNIDRCDKQTLRINTPSILSTPLRLKSKKKSNEDTQYCLYHVQGFQIEWSTLRWKLLSIQTKESRQLRMTLSHIKIYISSQELRAFLRLFDWLDVRGEYDYIDDLGIDQPQKLFLKKHELTELSSPNGYGKLESNTPLCLWETKPVEFCNNKHMPADHGHSIRKTITQQQLLKPILYTEEIKDFQNPETLIIKYHKHRTSRPHTSPQQLVPHSASYNPNLVSDINTIPLIDANIAFEGFNIIFSMQERDLIYEESTHYERTDSIHSSPVASCGSGGFPASTRPSLSLLWIATRPTIEALYCTESSKKKNNSVISSEGMHEGVPIIFLSIGPIHIHGGHAYFKRREHDILPDSIISKSQCLNEPHYLDKPSDSNNIQADEKVEKTKRFETPLPINITDHQLDNNNNNNKYQITVTDNEIDTTPTVKQNVKNIKHSKMLIGQRWKASIGFELRCFHSAAFVWEPIIPRNTLLLDCRESTRGKVLIAHTEPLEITFTTRHAYRFRQSMFLIKSQVLEGFRQWRQERSNFWSCKALYWLEGGIQDINNSPMTSKHNNFSESVEYIPEIRSCKSLSNLESMKKCRIEQDLLHHNDSSSHILLSSFKSIDYAILPYITNLLSLECLIVHSMKESNKILIPPHPAPMLAFSRVRVAFSNSSGLPVYLYFPSFLSSSNCLSSDNKNDENYHPLIGKLFYIPPNTTVAIGDEIIKRCILRTDENLPNAFQKTESLLGSHSIHSKNIFSPQYYELGKCHIEESNQLNFLFCKAHIVILKEPYSGMAHVPNPSDYQRSHPTFILSTFPQIIFKRSLGFPSTQSKHDKSFVHKVQETLKQYFCKSFIYSYVPSVDLLTKSKCRMVTDQIQKKMNTMSQIPLFLQSMSCVSYCPTQVTTEGDHLKTLLPVETDDAIKFILSSALIIKNYFPSNVSIGTLKNSQILCPLYTGTIAPGKLLAIPPNVCHLVNILGVTLDNAYNSSTLCSSIDPENMSSTDMSRFPMYLEKVYITCSPNHIGGTTPIRNATEFLNRDTLFEHSMLKKDFNTTETEDLQFSIPYDSVRWSIITLSSSNVTEDSKQKPLLNTSDNDDKNYAVVIVSRTKKMLSTTIPHLLNGKEQILTEVNIKSPVYIYNGLPLPLRIRFGDTVFDSQRSKVSSSPSSVHLPPYFILPSNSGAPLTNCSGLFGLFASFRLPSTSIWTSTYKVWSGALASQTTRRLYTTCIERTTITAFASKSKRQKIEFDVVVALTLTPPPDGWHGTCGALTICLQPKRIVVSRLPYAGLKIVENNEIGSNLCIGDGRRVPYLLGTGSFRLGLPKHYIKNSSSMSSKESTKNLVTDTVIPSSSLSLLNSCELNDPVGKESVSSNQFSVKNKSNVATCSKKWDYPILRSCCQTQTESQDILETRWVTDNKNTNSLEIIPNIYEQQLSNSTNMTEFNFESDHTINHSPLTPMQKIFCCIPGHPNSPPQTPRNDVAHHHSLLTKEHNKLIQSDELKQHKLFKKLRYCCDKEPSESDHGIENPSLSKISPRTNEYQPNTSSYVWSQIIYPDNDLFSQTKTVSDTITRFQYIRIQQHDIIIVKQTVPLSYPVNPSNPFSSLPVSILSQSQTSLLLRGLPPGGFFPLVNSQCGTERPKTFSLIGYHGPLINKSLSASISTDIKQQNLTQSSTIECDFEDSRDPEFWYYSSGLTDGKDGGIWEFGPSGNLTASNVDPAIEILELYPRFIIENRTGFHLECMQCWDIDYSNYPTKKDDNVLQDSSYSNYCYFPKCIEQSICLCSTKKNDPVIDSEDHFNMSDFSSTKPSYIKVRSGTKKIFNFSFPWNQENSLDNNERYMIKIRMASTADSSGQLSNSTHTFKNTSHTEKNKNFYNNKQFKLSNELKDPNKEIKQDNQKETDTMSSISIGSTISTHDVSEQLCSSENASLLDNALSSQIDLSNNTFIWSRSFSVIQSQNYVNNNQIVSYLGPNHKNEEDLFWDMYNRSIPLRLPNFPGENCIHSCVQFESLIEPKTGITRLIISPSTIAFVYIENHSISCTMMIRQPYYEDTELIIPPQTSLPFWYQYSPYEINQRLITESSGRDPKIILTGKTIEVKLSNAQNTWHLIDPEFCSTPVLLNAKKVGNRFWLHSRQECLATVYSLWDYGNVGEILSQYLSPQQNMMLGNKGIIQQGPIINQEIKQLRLYFPIIEFSFIGSHRELFSVQLNTLSLNVDIKTALLPFYEHDKIQAEFKIKQVQLSHHTATWLDGPTSLQRSRSYPLLTMPTQLGRKTENYAFSIAAAADAQRETDDGENPAPLCCYSLNISTLQLSLSPIELTLQIAAIAEDVETIAAAFWINNPTAVLSEYKLCCLPVISHRPPIRNAPPAISPLPFRHIVPVAKKSSPSLFSTPHSVSIDQLYFSGISIKPLNVWIGDLQYFLDARHVVPWRPFCYSDQKNLKKSSKKHKKPQKNFAARWWLQTLGNCFYLCSVENGELHSSGFILQQNEFSVLSTGISLSPHAHIALAQRFWTLGLDLVGSINFFGNISGLGSKISLGINETVKASHAKKNRCRQIFEGVSYLSLLTAEGAFNRTSRIAAVWSRILASLTFDEKYIQTIFSHYPPPALQLEDNTNVHDSPISEFFSNLLGSFSLKNNSFWTPLTCCLSALLKPLVAILEWFSITADGLRECVANAHDSNRINKLAITNHHRQARMVYGRHGIIKPYITSDADIQYLLNSQVFIPCETSQYPDYSFCCSLSNANLLSEANNVHVLVLTGTRLIYFNKKSCLKKNYQIVFDVCLGALLSISVKEENPLLFQNNNTTVSESFSSFYGYCSCSDCSYFYNSNPAKAINFPIVDYSNENNIFEYNKNSGSSGSTMAPNDSGSEFTPTMNLSFMIMKNNGGNIVKQLYEIPKFPLGTTTCQFVQNICFIKYGLYGGIE